MDVILLKDIPSLGTAGTVVRVKDGFGRNFLIPKRLAALATAERLRSVEAARAKRGETEAAKRQTLELLRAQLVGTVLPLPQRANRTGALYGSVRPEDALKLLRGRGLKLPTGSRISFAEPIDHVGRFPVLLHLSPDVRADLTLDVTTV